jgi:hypothetical protein
MVLSIRTVRNMILGMQEARSGVVTLSLIGTRKSVFEMCSPWWSRDTTRNAVQPVLY